MLIQMFFLFSSYAGIVGLIATDFTRFTELHWFLIGLATIATVALAHSIWKTKPKVFAEKKVIEYMRSWVGQEGKVAIFSRDMTWAVNDSQTNDLLFNKARKNELIICLPEQIALTKALKKEGAQIYTYKSLGIIPESRFTIVKFGRTDATVAIGRRTPDGKHQIEEIANGQHPSFAVANDLISIIKSLNEQS